MEAEYRIQSSSSTPRSRLQGRESRKLKVQRGRHRIHKELMKGENTRIHDYKFQVDSRIEHYCFSGNGAKGDELAMGVESVPCRLEP